MNLILINNEYYLTTHEKVNENDYGIGFAIGIEGHGAGFYKFKHDGTSKGKLNALCYGTTKVIASTEKIDYLRLINKHTTNIMLERFSIEDLAKKYSEQQAFGGLKKRYLSDGFIEGYKQGENKKFTLEDIEEAYHKGRRDNMNGSSCNCGECKYCEDFKTKARSDYNDFISFFIKNKYSWDVEIETEERKHFIAGTTMYEEAPKLSEDGYIIIKNIK